MKKIITFLLISLTLMVSLVVTNIAKETSLYNLIMKDHDKFVYNNPGRELKHTQHATIYFNEVTKKHNVGLTKVTYLNNHRILLNTNESRLLKLRDQNHNIHLFDRTLHIEVQDLKSTQHFSPVGTYFINGTTNDKKQVLALINQNVGDTINEDSEHLLSYLTLDQYTLSLLGLLTLLLVIVLCHYLQRNKAHFKTLSDLGYSIKDLLKYTFRDLKTTLII